MKNKIILEAETELKDNELREWVSKMQMQIETINERTKRQTRDIQEINRKIKELEKK